MWNYANFDFGRSLRRVKLQRLKRLALKFTCQYISGLKNVNALGRCSETLKKLSQYHNRFL